MCEADLDITHIIHRYLHRDVTVYAMHICCNTEYNKALLFTIPHIREKEKERILCREERDVTN
jgi:hypothetical protein